jgi:hypothetical protein
LAIGGKTPPHPAGWLFDRLIDDFHTDQAFKDIDSIEGILRLATMKRGSEHQSEAGISASNPTRSRRRRPLERATTLPYTQGTRGRV